MTWYQLVVGIAISLRVAWLIGELLHRHRFPHSGNQHLDQHSATFWDIANGIEPFGLVLAAWGFGRFTESPALQVTGLVFVLVGIAFRFAAMRTLGHYFTSTVTVRRDHQIISTGPYKYVRHPAYTGALVAHFGLGLAFGSWINLSVSLVPFVIAAWYRIRIEERVLLERFGDDYSIYSATRARLIPRIF